MVILNTLCGAEPGEIEPDLDLFESGLLDSFAVIQLIVELESAFAISMGIETLTREEMATPARIAEQVAKRL